MPWWGVSLISVGAKRTRGLSILPPKKKSKGLMSSEREGHTSKTNCENKYEFIYLFWRVVNSFLRFVQTFQIHPILKNLGETITSHLAKLERLQPSNFFKDNLNNKPCHYQQETFC
jgi:hypothetical protein